MYTSCYFLAITLYVYSYSCPPKLYIGVLIFKVAHAHDVRFQWRLHPQVARGCTEGVSIVAELQDIQ